MKLFSIKGLSGVAEIVLETEGSRTLHDLREVLVRKRGLSPEAAERVADDLLVVALTRLARNFERVKGQHIDTVIKLRTELDGLYHDIFIAEGAGTQAGIKQAVDARIGRINSLYAELDRAMAEATLPLDRMKIAAEADEGLLASVKKIEPDKPPYPDRPVEADLAKEGKTGKSRLERKGLVPHGEGYKVRFGDGAETVLRIKDGRYTAEIYPPPGGVAGGAKPTVISEFMLSRDPYSADLRTTSVLQRNHVVQNSLMEKLFGSFGYDGNSVPTIWLRDSRAGSPHGQVTALQREFKTGSGTAISEAERLAGQLRPGGRGSTALAPSQMNLAELQRTGVRQMRAVGAPEATIAEYLKQFDRNFTERVLPNLQNRVATGRMTQAQMDSLLGDWKPGRGLP